MITLHVLPRTWLFDDHVPIVKLILDFEPTAEQMSLIRPVVEDYVKTMDANEGILLVEPVANTGCHTHNYYRRSDKWSREIDVLTAAELIELCGTITIGEDGTVDDDTLPSTAAVA